MGAAAVPLAVGLGTASVAGQVIQSQSMKSEMEKQRRNQKEAAEKLATDQKRKEQMSEATLKRDELRAAQMKNRPSRGRQSTILTSGLESQPQSYGKTLLGS